LNSKIGTKRLSLRHVFQSEVAECRKEQPFEIIPESFRSRSHLNTLNSQDQDGEVEIDVDGRETNASEANPSGVSDVPMDTDSNNQIVSEFLIVSLFLPGVNTYDFNILTAERVN